MFLPIWLDGKRLDLVNNHAPFNVVGANYVSQVFVLQKSSFTFCQLVALVYLVHFMIIMRNYLFHIQSGVFFYGVDLLSQNLHYIKQIILFFRCGFVFLATLHFAAAVFFSGKISYTTLHNFAQFLRDFSFMEFDQKT